MTANQTKNNKLRVAIVLMQFGYGGAERMVALLASHLPLDELEVKVFCVYGAPMGNVMERMVMEHGVQIEYLGKDRGFSPAHVLKTTRALREFGADVVHTHLGAAMYCAHWAKLTGRRALHTLHNIPEKEFGSLKRSLMRSLYRSGNYIPVAISERNRELTASYYGLPVDRVEMVVNPVDVEKFSDVNPKPWGERSWDFVHVARFGAQKNHKGLVEAVYRVVNGIGVESMPGLRIALVGDGPLEDEIRALVDERGLQGNVEFLGTRDDVAGVLHDSRCFILPSKYEGLPMSILEAMAAGLPVLATAVGGVPDVVEDGVTGKLIPAGDSVALAEAMVSMMSGKQGLASMSSASKARALSYDCGTTARSYMELYGRYGMLRER